VAFCNSCGATLEAGAKFCKNCGVAVPLTTMTAPPPAKSGGNALKIILLLLAGVVFLGILGVGAASFVAWRIARHSRIENRNGQVRVETPLGTMESTNDPAEVGHNLGLEVYPGAKVRKGSAANVSFGGMHTSAAVLESDDPPATVYDFYKSKLPDARVSSYQNDNYSMVAGDKNNMTTVHIQSQDGKTVIQISKLIKSGGAGN
jgi:hypothetical protein